MTYNTNKNAQVPVPPTPLIHPNLQPRCFVLHLLCSSAEATAAGWQSG